MGCPTKAKVKASPNQWRGTTNRGQPQRPRERLWKKVYRTGGTRKREEAGRKGRKGRGKFLENADLIIRLRESTNGPFPTWDLPLIVGPLGPGKKFPLLSPAAPLCGPSFSSLSAFWLGLGPV